MNSSPSHEKGVQGARLEAKLKVSMTGPIPAAKSWSATRMCQKKSGSMLSATTALEAASEIKKKRKSQKPKPSLYSPCNDWVGGNVTMLYRSLPTPLVTRGATCAASE